MTQGKIRGFFAPVGALLAILLASTVALFPRSAVAEEASYPKGLEILVDGQPFTEFDPSTGLYDPSNDGYGKNYSVPSGSHISIGHLPEGWYIVWFDDSQNGETVLRVCDNKHVDESTREYMWYFPKATVTRSLEEIGNARLMVELDSSGNGGVVAPGFDPMRNYSSPKLPHSSCGVEGTFYSWQADFKYDTSISATTIEVHPRGAESPSVTWTLNWSNEYSGDQTPQQPSANERAEWNNFFLMRDGVVSCLLPVDAKGHNVADSLSGWKVETYGPTDHWILGADGTGWYSRTGTRVDENSPDAYEYRFIAQGKETEVQCWLSVYLAESETSNTGKLRRVAGDTRYQTMSGLVDLGGFATGGTVVVASGANYPDALAAASLAGESNAPILLTDPESLSEETASQINKLKPTKIFIVGGSAAVSQQVESQLRDVAIGAGSSCDIKRVSGQTRYDTALQIARELGSSQKQVIIATGADFADALSISPFSYSAKTPIILCDPSTGLSDDELSYLRGVGAQRAIIVGGTSAVSSSVEGQLRGAGVSSTVRLSGATRYSTSVKVAEFSKGGSDGDPMSLDGCVFATGSNFPDALAAGPVAGKNKSLVLLVDGNENYPNDIINKSVVGNVSSAYIAGGESAVGAGTANSLARMMGLELV